MMWNQSARDIYWLARELIQEFNRGHDASLTDEFLPDLDVPEKETLLEVLFWEALKDRNWSLAEHCVVKGYPIVPNDSSDCGPLHDSMSLLGERPDVIEWLLEHGAEVERRGHNNWTPLIAAILSGSEETVVKMLSAGADVDASTVIDYDMTPLMIAAKGGQETIVRMLLAGDADVRRKNKWGEDASRIAELSGYPFIARLLSQ